MEHQDFKSRALQSEQLKKFLSVLNTLAEPLPGIPASTLQEICDEVGHPLKQDDTWSCGYNVFYLAARLASNKRLSANVGADGNGFVSETQANLLRKVLSYTLWGCLPRLELPMKVSNTQMSKMLVKLHEEHWGFFSGMPHHNEEQDAAKIPLYASTLLTCLYLMKKTPQNYVRCCDGMFVQGDDQCTTSGCACKTDQNPQSQDGTTLPPPQPILQAMLDRVLTQHQDAPNIKRWWELYCRGTLKEEENVTWEGHLQDIRFACMCVCPECVR